MILLCGEGPSSDLFIIGTNIYQGISGTRSGPIDGLFDSSNNTIWHSMFTLGNTFKNTSA